MMAQPGEEATVAAMERPLLLRDFATTSLLAVAAAFAIVAPQGLTWLPAVLLLVMLAGYGAPSHAEGWQRLAAPASGFIVASALFLAWAFGRSFAAGAEPQAPLTVLIFAGSLCNVVAVGLMSARVEAHGRWHWSYFPALALVLALAITLLLSRWVDLTPLAGPRLGFQWHFNRAALFLALCVPLGVFALWRAVGWSRFRWLWCAAFVAAAAAAVFASDSESAKLALLAVSLVGALGLWRPRLAVWLVVGAATGLLLLMPLAMAVWSQYGEGLFLGGPRHFTYGERLKIWHGMLEHIAGSPVIGNGVEYVRRAGHRDLITGAQVFHNHPHSFVMQTWVDLGAVGVGLMAACLIGAGRAIRTLAPLAQAMVVAQMAGVLAIWAVSHGMWQSWFVGLAGFALAFGLICARRAAREEAEGVSPRL